jgi:hypothetical protein
LEYPNDSLAQNQRVLASNPVGVSNLKPDPKPSIQDSFVSNSVVKNQPFNHQTKVNSSDSIEQSQARPETTYKVVQSLKKPFESIQNQPILNGKWC